MAYVVDEGGWLARWERTDHPETWQVECAREWLAGLQNDPRPPRCPLALRNHPHPQDELRAGLLLDLEAFLVYAINDVTEVVTVLYLGRTAPPEIVFHLP